METSFSFAALYTKYAIPHDSVSAMFFSFASIAHSTASAAVDPRYYKRSFEHAPYARPAGAFKVVEDFGTLRTSAPAFLVHVPSAPIFDAFGA